MNLKISKDILDMVPYKPGESKKDVKTQYNRDFFVKLASNESPLPPSEKIKSAILKIIDKTFLYPDPSSRDLRQAASKYFKISSKKILVGNGSNELIDLLIRLVCEPGESIMTSAGAFIAYKICAKASRANVIEIPLRTDYTIDLAAFSKTLEGLKTLPKIIFIPNPNNPTGSYIAKNEVDEFLSKWGGRQDLLVVFDEAYTEFVDVKDFPKILDFLKFENVLVLKTMSKVFGLASLRVGFLLGNFEILELIHRIRNPFNVNAFAQTAAIAALQDQESLNKIKNLIIHGRNDFSKFLGDLGLMYVPSQANFIFFETGEDALKVYEALLKHGVIVRSLIGYGFKTQLRITIGDEKQMEFAKKAFKKVFL